MRDDQGGASRLPDTSRPKGDVAAAHEPELSRQIRNHLGSELRALYVSLIDEQQPRRFLDLIARLDAAFAAQDAAAATAFRDELLAALPGLRAFAYSLAGNPVQADDLVQETLLKAWQNQGCFQQRSNFMAWACTILRNQFYTEMRKKKREVEDTDGVQAGSLIALPAQEHGIDLRKVWDYLGKIPALQREALLLVAAQGMTYEAAAKVIGCQVGTVKSRVSRARSLLMSVLGMPATRASA